MGMHTKAYELHCHKLGMRGVHNEEGGAYLGVLSSHWISKVYPVGFQFRCETRPDQCTLSAGQSPF